MNAPKHTPGPWAVDPYTTTATVRAADGVGVARCYQGDHDAALIAAAPELLDALKALTDWAREHTSPVQPNSPHRLLVSAHDAIAKATGAQS